MLRTGGFAGIRTGWEIALDEIPDADQWMSLVDACPWDSAGLGSSGNDLFVYQFQAGPRSTTLTETDVRGPWRELVDRIREEGRRIPRDEINRLLH